MHFVKWNYSWQREARGNRFVLMNYSSPVNPCNNSDMFFEGILHICRHTHVHLRIHTNTVWVAFLLGITWCSIIILKMPLVWVDKLLLSEKNLDEYSLKTFLPMYCNTCISSSIPETEACSIMQHAFSWTCFVNFQLPHSMWNHYVIFQAIISGSRWYGIWSVVWQRDSYKSEGAPHCWILQRKLYKHPQLYTIIWACF